MRVALVHNYYRVPGGEDVVFAGERELLKANGHEVFEFTKHNDELKTLGAAGRAGLVFSTVYNSKIKDEFSRFLKLTKPEVVHFHNTFPLMSPSVYSACREQGVPVVQTLHNYRIVCPGALLYRRGGLCDDCVRRDIAWPGIVHACYRGSRAQTSVVVLMRAVHRSLKTWQRKVDIYIALNEFMRRKMIEGGLHAEKIAVKPNFVDPDPGEGRSGGEYAVFVGRLSSEKGIELLLSAWRGVKGMRLKIAGEGPLTGDIKDFIRRHRMDNVELLGFVPREQVFGLLKDAAFVVFPSLCFEGFSMAAIESFACGKAVIAASPGAAAGIVDDGRTGLHFRTGDRSDLAEKVRWAVSHGARMLEMGREARKEYLSRYTARDNYSLLTETYHAAIENNRKRTEA